MIRLVNVRHFFEDIPALKGVSLEVKKGTTAGIIGPGGGGKSTLCKIIAGLLRPSSGVVFVGGRDMMKADAAELRAAQSQIGVQFQNDALFEHMSVLENVEYPLRRKNVSGATELRGRALEQLAMTGLNGLEDRYPSQLSGGQRRRAALARACVSNPKLLICDEPTAGLDPVTSRKILDMIAGIHYQANNTVLIISSDVLGLMSVVDKAVLLWDGLVIAEGPPAAFWRDKRKQVRRFLDDAKLPVAVTRPGREVSWD
jgi:phospholipid/cholesterol/gamma-HCH transport system ATP-binding protein